MTRNDFKGQLEMVWGMLEGWRDHHPEGTKHNDEFWNEVCTAMAWIEEDLEAAYNGEERMD
jgi:hypothetical protein